MYSKGTCFLSLCNPCLYTKVPVQLTHFLWSFSSVGVCYLGPIRQLFACVSANGREAVASLSNVLRCLCVLANRLVVRSCSTHAEHVALALPLCVCVCDDVDLVLLSVLVHFFLYSYLILTKFPTLSFSIYPSLSLTVSLFFPLEPSPWQQTHSKHRARKFLDCWPLFQMSTVGSSQTL